VSRSKSTAKGHPVSDVQGFIRGVKEVQAEREDYRDRQLREYIKSQQPSPKRVYIAPLPKAFKKHSKLNIVNKKYNKLSMESGWQ
jgi:hypothetical protein